MQTVQTSKETKVGLFTRIMLALYSLQAFAFSLVQTSKTLRARGGISAVMGLVLGGIAIVILVVVVIVIDLFTNVATGVAGLSTAQKGNLTTIVNTGNSALQLGAIVPLIIIAIAIIGAVLGIFAYLRFGRGP